MRYIREFRDFAMRGNLIDMAVGIVIGAAFATITKAFIDGIFMPLVGLIFQVGDLSQYTVKIGQTAAGQPNYILIGSFIGALINFLIMAFAMFIVVKAMNAMKKKQAEAPASPAEPSKEEILLSEIRDLLKQQHK